MPASLSRSSRDTLGFPTCHCKRDRLGKSALGWEALCHRIDKQGQISCVPWVRCSPSLGLSVLICK